MAETARAGIEVGLDTTAFSALFSTRRFACAPIADAIRRTSARIVVFEHTFVESTTTTNAAAAQGRLRSLAELAREVGLERIGYAVHPRELWRHELRADAGPMTPCRPPEDLARVLGFAEGASADEFAAWHREHLEALREFLRIGSWGALTKKARGGAKRDFVRDFRLGIARLFDELRGSINAEFPAHAVFLAFYWLIAGAGILHGEDVGALQDTMKSHDNDFRDALIASNAAYCDVLLVDDRPFAARVAACRAAGFTRTEPMSSADWLCAR